MHARTRRSTVLVVALATISSLVLLSPASAQTPDDPAVPADPPPVADPPADPLVRGQAAIDLLADRLPDVAATFGLTDEDLQDLFAYDGTLAIDPNDELVYVDVPAPDEEALATPAEEPADPPTEEEVFHLASLPGADKTIYLDVDGHITTDTSFNSAYGEATIASPAYDADGDPTTWSPSELQLIHDSWAVVAEDFAPWNINVTTVEPAVGDLRHEDPADTRWGIRVVLTDDTFAQCGCGGLAYVGAFDDPADEPTFVFGTTFAGISQAITHQVGHTLGLAHDGIASGTSTYEGHHGTDEPGWAPIMGAAGDQPLRQWSQQEYLGASNAGPSANHGNGPDDLDTIASMSNGNGFGLRPDDHGDAADPTPLDGPTPSVSGIIGTRLDVDAFSFATEGGEVSLSATGDPIRSNLDIELTLLDASGSVVASENPVDSLAASLSTTVEAGTYTVTVDGVGLGTPDADPPTGYTDYGSLGQFTISGSIEGVAAPEPDSDPPAAPTGFIAVGVDGTAVLGWAPNTEADLASYVVQRSATAGGPYTTIATVSAGLNGSTDAIPPGGDNYYVVLAEDASGNRSPASDEMMVQIVPSLTSVALGETLVYGVVTGDYSLTQAADGQSQRITEDLSGGVPANRHDRIDHRWTLPATSGNQILRVVASVEPDAGDADDGFAVEWSADKIVWFPLTVIAPGETIDGTFAVGGADGEVHIRITDTDRTPRQQSPDTVLVDLLEISGDGDPVAEPDPVEALVELTTGTTPTGLEDEETGTATVVVVDDRGDPVEGAEVVIAFTGDFIEDAIIVTDAAGTATAETSTSVPDAVVLACVESVDAGDLTWTPGDEAC